MGNCMGCKRRWGRRRRGRRSRAAVDIVRNSTVSGTDQIHVILSHGTDHSHRPTSREEARMMKDLQNGEEPKTFAESVAYCLGLDDRVEEYNPELNAVIQSISDKYVAQDTEENEFEYTVEEEATMGKVMDEKEIEAGKRKLAEKKQKRAKSRMDEMMKRRSNKVGLAPEMPRKGPDVVSDAVTEITTNKAGEILDVESKTGQLADGKAEDGSQVKVKKKKKPLRKSQVKPIDDLVKTGQVDHNPQPQTFTQEEVTLMRNIVVEQDRQLQKLDLEKKMSEADARREKILAKKSKKAKFMAKRESSDDQVPSTSYATEAKPDMQACSSSAFTKDEEVLMQGIVEEDDVRIRKEAFLRKMAEAEARREEKLRRKSERAKKMAGSSHETEVQQGTSGPTEPTSEPGNGAPPTASAFTKDEEVLMQGIVEEDDVRLRKETFLRKMAEAEARREKKLRRKSERAKKMAGSSHETEVQQGTSGLNEPSNEPGNGAPPTAAVFTKEEEAIMQGIVDEDDMREKKAALQDKMLKAEARRQERLKKRSEKAKKMATSSHDLELEQATSGPNEQEPDNGAAAASSTAFTKNEEVLMQEIVDEADLQERKEAHSNKMARAEARRQEKLRRKTEKAKKMGKSNHNLETQPGTSGLNGRSSLTKAASNDKVAQRVRRELQPDPLGPKYSTEEEILMQEILDDFGNDKGQGHSRLGEG